MNSFKLFLLEKNRLTSSLVPNSEHKRKKRAQNVKILSLKKYTTTTAPRDKPLLKGWKYWEFKTRSAEKVQGRDHVGYLVLDQNNNVKDVFCDCADAQFFWRYALVRSDLASWETYPEYKNIEDHAPHTRKPSNITNPKYERKLCKHLIAIFNRLKI